jgi:hypothetical protein
MIEKGFYEVGVLIVLTHPVAIVVMIREQEAL